MNSVTPLSFFSFCMKRMIFIEIKYAVCLLHVIIEISFLLLCVYAHCVTGITSDLHVHVCMYVYGCIGVCLMYVTEGNCLYVLFI